MADFESEQIEQMKIQNRLYAIELMFKLMELIANKDLKTLSIDTEIQKFLIDVAGNTDMPIAELKPQVKGAT